MKTSTREDILRYIKKRKEVTAKELAETFGITPQALFRHLKRLQQDGVISKVGTPPRVFYVPATEPAQVANLFDISPEIREIIQREFLYISPSGQRLEGLAGFVEWCQVYSYPFVKTAAEYAKNINNYASLANNGLIDGMPKLGTTFGMQVYLDEMYYLDFYSIEQFGRTKLGSLLLYGKQGQNRQLIKEVYDLTAPRIRNFVRERGIDAVGYIPPTIHRTVQLQKELERMLNLDLPHIDFVKAGQGIAVPQKILRYLHERVENARRTIYAQPQKAHENILLIDDAVGSGATLNEAARKLKERGFAPGKVIGLALVGSLRGFEVLSEV